MRTIKVISISIMAIFLASCNNDYNVVGTWENITIDTKRDGKETRNILIEKFNENGDWEKQKSYANGLINSKEKGTYIIAGDSVFITRTQLVVNGRDWPNDTGNKIRLKILRSDDENLEYINRDDTIRLNKATMNK